jgi:PAS domain S-box-containing protein
VRIFRDGLFPLDIRQTFHPPFAARVDALPLDPDASGYPGILFRKSPVPMWLLELDTRRYLAVNEAALRTYGYAEDEFLRLRPEDLRLPQDRAALEASLASTGDGPVAQGPARHVCRDGTLLDVEVTTQDLRMEGRRLRMVMALDVTAPARAAYRLQRLHAVTSMLARALTPEDVARAVIDEGIVALGARSGSLALLREGGAELEIVRARGYDAEIIERFRRISVAAPLPLSDAVRERRPVFLHTEDERDAAYPDIRDLPRTQPFGPLAAVPLLFEDRPLGAIGLTFPEGFELGDDERAFVLNLAAQAAQAMERARLLDAERRARLEAEAANRAKTEFLSAMSHELRTPLNAILGYADLMEFGLRGPVTAQQLEDLGKIKRAQAHLLGIIDDILNFARVEAGRLEFESEPMEVCPLLEEMETLISPQLAARDLCYACSCDPGLVALADRDRVRQILLNLLSNAVKFTDPGGRVELRGEADGDAVALRVRDTGRGIPAERLEAVFEPIVQIERHRTAAAQQGVGLGLAISREMARCMGADLVAESVAGQGSRFTLMLRRA